MESTVLCTKKRTATSATKDVSCHVTQFTTTELGCKTFCYSGFSSGNNPIKYTDPDGMWNLYFGYSGQAGAGVGVQGGGGFFIGFGKDGLKVGTYVTGGVGAEFGVVASVGVVIGFDVNDTMDGDSVTVGGSVEAIAGVGVDVSITSEGISGGSLTVGAGIAAPEPLPVEVHINVTHTEVTSEINITKAVSDATNEILERIVEEIIGGL
jgi:hypothetical protein